MIYENHVSPYGLQLIIKIQSQYLTRVLMHLILIKQFERKDKMQGFIENSIFLTQCLVKLMYNLKLFKFSKTHWHIQCQCSQHVIYSVPAQYKVIECSSKKKKIIPKTVSVSGNFTRCLVAILILSCLLLLLLKIEISKSSPNMEDLWRFFPIDLHKIIYCGFIDPF